MCQGPDEKDGQETGRSSPALKGACLGGDTPANLSGRGCRGSDGSVGLRGTKVTRETEREPLGEEDRDEEGVRERARGFVVGSLLDPLFPPRCLREGTPRRTRSRSRAR